jgi:hypothetical protein
MSVYITAVLISHGAVMYQRVSLVCVLVLSACGQTLSTPVSVSTSAAPPDAYACARKQLGDLGYKQTSNDSDEYRVTATKLDYESRRADVQFRRIHNKLEVDIGAEADGKTSLVVIPRTFAEYSTQRGPTEVQEEASDVVKADANTILERCRS